MFPSKYDTSDKWGTFAFRICPFCGSEVTSYPIEEKSYLKPEEYIKIDESNREKVVELGKFCNRCKKLEYYDISSKDFRLFSKKLFCQSCAINEFIKENPDPSDSRNRFEFNKGNLQWDLIKITRPCLSCGKNIFLKPNEQWKKYCINCYKKIKGW